MQVLAVLCHPKPDSFSTAVLERFVEGAETAGHTVEVADLYREGFNPVMDMRDLQQFEGIPMPPEILAEQARVEQADAMCFVFPMWWYGMPAMLKGWIDRVWSAGWAYPLQHDPDRSLLKSRPCTLLVPTGASSKLMDEWGLETDIVHIWRDGILAYCGVEPIAIHLLLDSAYDSGVETDHLNTAYQAGLDCMLKQETATS